MGGAPSAGRKASPQQAAALALAWWQTWQEERFRPQCLCLQVQCHTASPPRSAGTVHA